MKKKKTDACKSGKRTEPAVLREGAEAAWGRVVTVRDAKAHLSALLEWVAAGHELTITSDGRPKARLVNVSSSEPRKVFEGMGDYLLKQPIHGGPSAEEVVREDRDGRGW
jgi:prevent-host-death family protein